MLIIIEYSNSLIRKSFTDYFKYQGITIKNNQIILSDGYVFNDDSLLKKLEFKKYCLKYQNSFESFNLYLYKADCDYTKYGLYENSDFVLANTNNASVVSFDSNLNKYYLYYHQGRLETNYPNLLLNNHLYQGEKLKNKDRIDLISFSFVYFDNYLYIINYKTDIKLKKYKLKEVIVKYDETRPKLSNYYEKKFKEIVVDKLNKFAAPKRNNKRKLIYQMGPTLTMSLAMIFVAGINVYKSYESNGELISLIALIVMPLTMLVSGVLWPLLSNGDEKRSFKKEYTEAKKEYLSYLDDYENKLNKNINDNLKSLAEYQFDVIDIKNKIFYLTNKSNYFLSICLGFETRSIETTIEETSDLEIDEKLNRIKYRLNNIDNSTLLLSLKENRRVSVVSNHSKYFLDKILLELCYKYHYNDLNIAIYSKDEDILKGKEYIPHLFYEKERLTIDNERNLRALNTYKLDRPLVILLYNFVDISFDNKMISIILFTDNKDLILKDSNAVIEYKDKGYLYRDGIKEFNYYLENIDFNHYYHYLSLYMPTKEKQKYEFFRDFFPGLNIEEYYQERSNGLRADFAYINNEILSFDLHESKDGPHGLIGGSTGSGKSELIISLLLSLALRYPPDYLNIILIDYKGGGIKESLSYLNTKIPHIIASIDNLEEDNFERLMVAIKRECKERQNKFLKLAKLAETSIMNLDEYLDLCDLYGLEKISHLLIVVDEFAELKKENPYLIKELVSISRIGRSLGLHLILATQKPGGVIDEEIFANAHFKIALKLMDDKDSLDIIKSKEAAYLRNPGEFYLKVDDSLIRAKALYSKKDIDGKDGYEVAMLDKRLDVVSKRIRKNNNITFESEFIVERIIQTSKKLNIKTKSLQFSCPDELSIDELKKKYQLTNNLIMGEVDDYLNARKELLFFDPNENLLIYSSRLKEIEMILNQLNNLKLESIVIGSNTYAGGYIKESLLYENEEDILFLFNKMLNDKFSKIHIIIEDLNTFLAYNEHYLELLFNLIRRSSVSNFVFYIFTLNSNVNFKLLNSIKHKLAIGIYDKQDVINLFSSKGEYCGSSYFFKEEPITFVPYKQEEFKFVANNVNGYLERIPEDIKFEENQNGVLLGYDIESRKRLDLANAEKLLITGFDSSLLDVFKKHYERYLNTKIIKYHHDLVMEEYNSVLWLGENIYSQRLFYVEKVEHLNENEAYLYKDNKLRKIKTVNYE